jgi:hypothetical protein
LVLIVPEDHLAVIASGDDVVDRSGIFDTDRLCHEARPVIATSEIQAHSPMQA